MFYIDKLIRIHFIESRNAEKYFLAVLLIFAIEQNFYQYADNLIGSCTQLVIGYDRLLLLLLFVSVIIGFLESELFLLLIAFPLVHNESPRVAHKRIAPSLFLSTKYA